MTSPDSFATFHVKGKLTMTTELTLCQRLDNAVTERNLLLQRMTTVSVFESITVTPLLQAAQIKVERLAAELNWAEQAK